jgi:hypothetical protein
LGTGTSTIQLIEQIKYRLALDLSWTEHDYTGSSIKIASHVVLNDEHSLKNMRTMSLDLLRFNSFTSQCFVLMMSSSTLTDVF